VPDGGRISQFGIEVWHPPAVDPGLGNLGAATALDRTRLVTELPLAIITAVGVVSLPGLWSSDHRVRESKCWCQDVVFAAQPSG
jgi:hypothetical protein